LVIPYRWPSILVAADNDKIPYWYSNGYINNCGAQFANLGQFVISAVKVQMFNNTRNMIYTDGQIDRDTVEYHTRHQDPIIYSTYLNDSLVISQRKNATTGVVTVGLDVAATTANCAADATKYLRISNNIA
jgi:hypothetical protein